MSDHVEDEQKISDLLFNVVTILQERGIEATESQVRTWAVDMVKWYHEYSGKTTTIQHWLIDVIHKSPTPTMCLHIHFGDAKN